MTVATTIAREVYTTDGVVTEFDFHFKLLEEEDLEVYYRGPDGTEDGDPLTLSTDYTVSASPWPSGGTVTMILATEAAGTLTLRRNRAYTQETLFPEGGKFPASSVEESLDALSMLCQQLLDDMTRTVKLPVSDEGDYEFPIPSERANKVLKFGSDGAFETGDTQYFRSGEGVPGASLGSDEDHYLDLLTGDVYKKSSGAWAEVGSVLGPTGPGAAWGTMTGTLADQADLQTELDALQASVNATRPAGEVGFFAMDSAPTGWLKANGTTLSRTAYANLFAAIGDTFGAGDGSTTFEVPDMRGEFPRGWDDGRGIDSARVFGSAQGHALQIHGHQVLGKEGSSAGPNPVPVMINSNLAGTDRTAAAGAGGYGARSITDDTGGGTVQTATETRPRNVALLACIRY